MRPKLKVSNLISLQDARSSAAVGFDMISFNLERGNTKKLSASMIWNMVNWLSGPEILLEMNVASLAELEEIKKLFQWHRITIPVEEWNEMVFNDSSSVILRGDRFVDPKDIAAWVAETDEDHDLKVELSLPDVDAAKAYESVKDSVFLHFPSIEILQEYIRNAPSQPFGYSLREEAEEEPGFLHYEKIDDLMELLEEQFPA